MQIGSLQILLGDTWTRIEPPQFQYRMWGMLHPLFFKLFGSYFIGWTTDIGVYPYNEKTTS